MSNVLVTGGSGFIGSHAIIQLLELGHNVRGTIRSLSGEAAVRTTLSTAGITDDAQLSVYEADLEDNRGWDEAIAGCDYVLHVASPFPTESPEHEDELIVPAREGALRVLRAARRHGVKRVVLTSSFAAIGYGHAPRKEPFTEATWTNLDGRVVTPYAKSKTIAEQAAWQFVNDEGGELQLSVVNPVAVFGPVLGPKLSTSVYLIQRLMNGSMPASPQIYYGVVDVRDVVDLHIRAMTDPAAGGERFIAAADNPMSIAEMAATLREHLGEAAKRTPRREFPNWLLRMVAPFSAQVRTFAPELGIRKEISNTKARDVLGWTPRSREEALVATAESLLKLGLVDD